MNAALKLPSLQYSKTSVIPQGLPRATTRGFLFAVLTAKENLCGIPFGFLREAR
jgi:hypothetical protein